MDVTLLKKTPACCFPCFPVNIAKFLKTAIFQKTCKRNGIWLYLQVPLIYFMEEKPLEFMVRSSWTPK